MQSKMCDEKLLCLCRSENKSFCDTGYVGTERQNGDFYEDYGYKDFYRGLFQNELGICKSVYRFRD